MRFFCDGFRRIRFSGAAVTVALVLAGCSEDPGLQERVNRLQAEMQEKDRQLLDAQSALEKTKSELKSARAASANASKPAAEEPPAPSPSPSPAFLAREQVEESYSTASKAMQKRLASELKNYTVENCAEFPVVLPSDEYPYHSKVVVTFRSDNGRSYRLEFPVSADAKGKWSFPNSSDVAGALADSRSLDANNTAASTPANIPTNTPASTPTPANSPRVAQNNPTPAPTSRPTSQNNSSVVPGQTANETRVIDWGDGRGKTTNNRPDRSPTPTSVSSTPAGSTTPMPAMQADKDVKIHW